MIEYAFGTVFVATGIYCLVMKRNLIKKIMGLGIITMGIHLLLITMGYREGIPPIVTPENLLTFSRYSVDPIPQALVLTSIVIDLSITALALSMAVLIYRKRKTLDTKKIRELFG
ncbi:MAG: cation:proton antiporter subunit C [archaeon]|nr:MAG: cation:proton antiporter subunit C [archaeon]